MASTTVAPAPAAAAGPASPRGAGQKADAPSSTSHLAHVTIAVNCTNLPKLYPNVDAVTCVYVSLRQSADKPWESAGRTEVVIDEPNPTYHRTFELLFSARRHQHVKLDIWDVADKTGSILKGATLIGTVELSFVRLVRLHGQPLLIPLLNARGSPIGNDAALRLRAVSIKRFREPPKAPPAPPPPVRFHFRRVKAWVFSEDDRFHDWVDVPVADQTAAKKNRGEVMLPIEGDARVSDLMALVLQAAGDPPDPKLALDPRDFQPKKKTPAGEDGLEEDETVLAERSKIDDKKKKKMQRAAMRARRAARRLGGGVGKDGSLIHGGDSDEEELDDTTDGVSKSKASKLRARKAKALRQQQRAERRAARAAGAAGDDGSEDEFDESDSSEVTEDEDEEEEEAAEEEQSSESDPDGDDTSDEDEATRVRRQRKEEEMTVKERMLLKVHNRNVRQAYLTVTVNDTTRQMRVTALNENDFDPLLSFLLSDYMFGSDKGSALVTLSSHGFVVSVPPVAVRAVADAQAKLLERVRASEAAAKAAGINVDVGRSGAARQREAAAAAASAGASGGIAPFTGTSLTLGGTDPEIKGPVGNGIYDWELVSKTCRHCKTILANDRRV